MKNILYLNYGITKACGVYDLGLRHYNAIKNIEEYNFNYAEIRNMRDYYNACMDPVPDLIIFNYLEGLSMWMNKAIHEIVCPKICIPHDMRQDDFNLFRRDDLFDNYIILDKNSPESTCGRILKTNRPLMEFETEDHYQNSIPRIGSFGFALTHKNFHLIAREVNNTFDEAIINFHMPKAHFDFEDQTNQVVNMCKAEITKPGIKLNITTDFLSEKEVVNKLHLNDINCLFYDAPRDLGVSSSLDFLISAQKPILITESPMFRSFSKNLSHFPNVSLLDMWENWEVEYMKSISAYENSVNNIKTETKAIFDRILQ